MKINKALLLTPLFAVLPYTMKGDNSYQLRTSDNIIYLEQSPEQDVVQVNNKKNSTKTFDLAPLLEIFLFLGCIGLFAYMASAFDDMEKKDKQDFIDGMRNGG